MLPGYIADDEQLRKTVLSQIAPIPLRCALVNGPSGISGQGDRLGLDCLAIAYLKKLAVRHSWGCQVQQLRQAICGIAIATDASVASTDTNRAHLAWLWTGTLMHGGAQPSQQARLSRNSRSGNCVLTLGFPS